MPPVYLKLASTNRGEVRFDPARRDDRQKRNIADAVRDWATRVRSKLDELQKAFAFGPQFVAPLYEYVMALKMPGSITAVTEYTGKYRRDHLARYAVARWRGFVLRKKREREAAHYRAKANEERRRRASRKRKRDKDEETIPAGILKYPGRHCPEHFRSESLERQVRFAPTKRVIVFTPVDDDDVFYINVVGPERRLHHRTGDLESHKQLLSRKRRKSA